MLKIAKDIVHYFRYLINLNLQKLVPFYKMFSTAGLTDILQENHFQQQAYSKRKWAFVTCV
jgi:hypothetical protein